MVSTNDDLSVRIERLERDVRRLAEAGPPTRRENLVNQLSFLGWLKISGPTFAVMVFGFGLLWQAQQANTAQLMELSRSTNAQIAELSRSTNAQITELSRSMNEQFAELNRAIGRLEGAITGLQAAIDKLGERVDRLQDR
jgi:septal ring factor EnvC (AmiA/AmiB activator)